MEVFGIDSRQCGTVEGRQGSCPSHTEDKTRPQDYEVSRLDPRSYRDMSRCGDIEVVAIERGNARGSCSRNRNGAALRCGVLSRAIRKFYVRSCDVRAELDRPRGFKRRVGLVVVLETVVGTKVNPISIERSIGVCKGKRTRLSLDCGGGLDIQTECLVVRSRQGQGDVAPDRESECARETIDPRDIVSSYAANRTCTAAT